MVQKGCRQIWGPEFDTVLPENIQQVLDLGPLLNEILAEIKNSGLVIPNA